MNNQEFFFVLGNCEGRFSLLGNHVFATYAAAKQYADSLSSFYGAFVVKQVLS